MDHLLCTLLQHHCLVAKMCTNPRSILYEIDYCDLNKDAQKSGRPKMSVLFKKNITINLEPLKRRIEVKKNEKKFEQLRIYSKEGSRYIQVLYGYFFRWKMDK
jgi:predicted metalloprotease